MGLSRNKYVKLILCSKIRNYVDSEATDDDRHGRYESGSNYNKNRMNNHSRRREGGGDISVHDGRQLTDTVAALQDKHGMSLDLWILLWKVAVYNLI